MSIDQGMVTGSAEASGRALADLVLAMQAGHASPMAEGAGSYRRFVDALGVALYTTDDQGRLTYFNDAAVQLWGRTPDLGEEWCGSWRLFWPDGRPMPHADCPMAIALHEGRAVRGTEAIAERPDGSRVHFEPYPTPLHDEGGRLVGGVNVLVDISERRRVEGVLRSTASDLELSNAIKDDFLGLVSHELRTPVTTILGNAQVLLGRAGALPSTEREMVSDIAEDASRLTDIIENLLQLSRLQGGDRPETEPILISRELRRQVATFERRRPSRRIETRILEPSPVVEAEATYLTLLVQNLLGNADKYSPPDSRIEVVLEVHPGEVRVHVLDRGLGIDEVDAEALFAPFYRSAEAQRSAGGLGLGLAVCRRIVDALGGRIWAQPREGGGADFGFALPCEDGADTD